MENGKQKVHPFINKNVDAEQGLTKREYFAAMAMKGILSDNKNINALVSRKIAIENYAVRIADALLAELDKPKSE